MYRHVPKSMYQQKCLEAKGRECHFCGTEENIHVHHINGDRTCNDLDNLIPACKSCHWDIHNGTNEEWNDKLLPIEERRHVIATEMLRDFHARQQSTTESSKESTTTTTRSKPSSSSGSAMTIPDPELVEKKTVDNSGRLYLGTEYSGQKFRVVLEPTGRGS